MNKYELVSIVDAHKTQDQKDEIFKQITDSIIKCGGKIINAHVWLDKQKISFSIKKKIEGTYHLINFEGASSCIAKIKEILRINEDVLRYLIIKE